jgi:transcriptional regulator with XRE-family HTH domain
MRLSQTQFAARFGFSLDSIQNWEQGHRKPEGPARILLAVIAKNPKAVEEALGSLWAVAVPEIVMGSAIFTQFRKIAEGIAYALLAANKVKYSATTLRHVDGVEGEGTD